MVIGEPENIRTGKEEGASGFQTTVSKIVGFLYFMINY